MPMEGSLLPVLVLGVMLVSMAAHAQTPAGTTIRNQASATFEDLIGNTYMATSNEVTTIVLPVYGVSVLPDDSGENPPLVPAMSQNAIPGQTVYYSYMMTNTGNDVDTYSLEPLLDAVNTTMTLGIGDITIYHDVNGNGILDGGEPGRRSGTDRHEELSPDHGRGRCNAHRLDVRSASERRSGQHGHLHDQRRECWERHCTRCDGCFGRSHRCAHP